MSTEQPHNPQGTQAGTEDEAGLRRARAILKSLAKFIHGKKIYAKTNPNLDKFAGELEESFRRFFEHEEMLVLAVDQFALKWEEETVYENDKREESMAFLLFKDGVGEITFHTGLTFEEVERFVDLVTEAMHNYSPEEDIVTTLWKADFEHISYRVLEDPFVRSDEQGWGQEPTQKTREPDDHTDLPSFEDKGRVIVDQDSALEPLSTYLETLVVQYHPGVDGPEREERFQETMGMVFNVSSEELKLCQEDVGKEKSKDELSTLLGMILDFTLLQGSDTTVQDVSDVIDKLVAYIIEEGNPEVINEVYHHISHFLENELPEGVEQHCRRWEKDLTAKPVLLKLVEYAKSRPGEAGGVFEYLKAIGAPAVEALCELLNEVSDPDLHKAASQAIVAAAGDGLADVMQRFDLDKPQIAVDVIHMVRAAKLKEIPKAVRELYYYPDICVRGEVIEFLSELGSDEAVQLLIKALDDEDKSVRMLGITALESVQKPLVTKRIKSLAFGKEIAKRDQDEREAVFKALGRILGQRAIPDLENLMSKKSLLKPGKKKENKILCLRALEQIRSAPSRRLLEQLAEDDDDDVRANAQRLLAKLEEDPEDAERHDAGVVS